MTQRRATLTRHLSTDEGTFGRWMSGTGFSCVTLERPAEHEHPRIPEGKYLCKLRYSPKRDQNVYGLLDVPGRDNIEIHAANWFFQLLGCIAPGREIAIMETPFETKMQGVTESRHTLAALMEDMKGEDFWLEIIDAPLKA